MRNLLKARYGITESHLCVKCNYCQQKICQIHGIKTRAIEGCSQFSPMRRHTVVRGGSISSK